MLENLEPKRVFYYFEELSKIPRPSYHEKEVSDFLAAFAREKGLEHYQDDMGNVIMIKPATAGYEDKPAIVVQGHMDMVCEKTSDCDKDMEKEGLDLVLEGDILSAKGTTLGADDGVGVAMALALLEDESLKHPRLEAVFTVAEEVGMDGARGLDTSALQGKYFLNLDCEMDNRCLVSCAGGGLVHVAVSINRAEYPGEVFCLTIGGGRGGHSGAEINEGRANTTVLLGRVLRRINDLEGWRLISLTGGGKDNAIPREASAVFTTESYAYEIEHIVEEEGRAIAEEFKATDPDIFVRCESAKSELAPMDDASTKAILMILSAMPDGVVAMSHDMEGMVETSLNLGITKTSEDQVEFGYCLRSSVWSAYEALKGRIVYLAKAICGSQVVTTAKGEYPAWEYVADSPLREKMKEIYRDMTGEELKVESIHAGLECGHFSGKMPGIDAVSFGPNMWDIHTPDERLSVSSTEKVYNFTRRIIEEL